MNKINCVHNCHLMGVTCFNHLYTILTIFVFSIVILLGMSFVSPHYVKAENCKWVNVGYNKTHFDKGEFCPAGSYITQLDFDGGGTDWKKKGNYPIIRKVKCCSLHRSSSSGGGDEKADFSGGVGKGDLDALWHEIERLNKRVDRLGQ